MPRLGLIVKIFSKDSYLALPGAKNEGFKGNSKESMFEGLKVVLKEDLKGDFMGIYKKWDFRD